MDILKIIEKENSLNDTEAIIQSIEDNEKLENKYNLIQSSLDELQVQLNEIKLVLEQDEKNTKLLKKLLKIKEQCHAFNILLSNHHNSIQALKNDFIRPNKEMEDWIVNIVKKNIDKIFPPQ